MFAFSFPIGIVLMSAYEVMGIIMPVVVLITSMTILFSRIITTTKFEEQKKSQCLVTIEMTNLCVVKLVNL